MRSFLLSMTALVGLSACGYSEAEMQTKDEKIQQLDGELRQTKKNYQVVDKRLEEVSAQNEAMVNRLRALGANVEELETERGSLAEKLNETRRALDELRQREKQSQARLVTFKDMLDKFKSMIQAGKLRVRVVRNQMVVELPEAILFDSGKAELKAEAEQTLTQVAQILVTIPNRNFQVAGHTDNVPVSKYAIRFPTNWELSTARAVSVTRFMLSKGVDPGKISAAGFSDTKPQATNDTTEGRALNRRIEIILVPNLDELPDLSSLDTGPKK